MDPFTAGALISGGVGLLGGLFGNQQSTAAARENRSWQEEMSNTAHQREVADLEAAGLNPILSAGGSGASTPGGGQAPQSDPTGSMVGAVSSAVAMKTAESTMDNQSADTANKKLMAAQIGAQTAVANQDVRAKELANQLNQATMQDQIKEARLRGQTGVENSIQGTVKGLMNSPSDILKYFKKSNQDFKKQNPSLP